MTKPKLSIIGAGNVGTQLARAFHAAGYSLVEICSRSASRAIPLAVDLQAHFVADATQLIDTADVYLFCISEEDLKHLPPLPQLSGKLLCHTSGSTAIEILNGHSSRTAVFYPLQTFSYAEQLDIQGIPILLEASAEDDLAILKMMAGSISGIVTVMPGEERKIAHLAAVIACNFSNYLYSCAETLLKSHGLAFDLLIPLIRETARKASLMSPEQAQTGPAVRADIEIIRRQEEILQSHPEILKIYQLITREIMHRYHPEAISLQDNKDVPDKKLS
jgi:predicted short-subunit dehydrogenase-like oxidoreductase (DUF2520 family)